LIFLIVMLGRTAEKGEYEQRRDHGNRGAHVPHREAVDGMRERRAAGSKWEGAAQAGLGQA